jgi:hypothetical protein
MAEKALEHPLRSKYTVDLQGSAPIVIKLIVLGQLANQRRAIAMEPE